ncbi:MAG: hypothetical protein LBR89_05035 [Holosporales bacterium]|jgi:hypothetical protein|nr:hypothetical protein [Holosporales bacterium]
MADINEALMVIALGNVLVSSFVAFVRTNKLVAVVWISLQLLILFVAFYAYYVVILWGLFIATCAALVPICTTKDEEKLQDIQIPERRTVDRKLVCAGIWGGCLCGAMSVVFWKSSFIGALIKKNTFFSTSLCAEDYCVIALLSLVVLVSIVGCIKLLKNRPDNTYI